MFTIPTIGRFGSQRNSPYRSDIDTQHNFWRVSPGPSLIGQFIRIHGWETGKANRCFPISLKSYLTNKKAKWKTQEGKNQYKTTTTRDRNLTHAFFEQLVFNPSIKMLSWTIETGFRKYISFPQGRRKKRGPGAGHLNLASNWNTSSTGINMLWIITDLIWNWFEYMSR